MSAPASPALVRQTERWFVRQGAPTMIEGYGFATHVLPRMLPALAFVTFASLAWLVPIRTVGSDRWVMLGVVCAVTVAAWCVTSVLVRRQPAFSRPAIIAILCGYAAMPVAVPLLQLTVDDAVTAPGGSVVGLLGFVIFFAAAFGATQLATTYGVGTLVARAVRHAVYDLRNSVHLLGRAVPAMLFVTLFLFFTGELWQAMNQFTGLRLTLIVGLFAAVTVLAAAARLRDEIGRVEQDLNPSILEAACRGTPLGEGVDPGPDRRRSALRGPAQRPSEAEPAGDAGDAPARAGGGGRARAVRVLHPPGRDRGDPAIAEQWIGAPVVYSDLLPGVPVALLRNATLFAAFGSMYFAVISMSDQDHRRQFFAPMIDEVERALEVRVVYLAVRRSIEP